MKKKYSEEQLPNAYAGLESILKSNKGGDGFFVGDGVSDHAAFPLLKVLGANPSLLLPGFKFQCTVEFEAQHAARGSA